MVGRRSDSAIRVNASATSRPVRTAGQARSTGPPMHERPPKWAAVPIGSFTHLRLLTRPIFAPSPRAKRQRAEDDPRDRRPLQPPRLLGGGKPVRVALQGCESGSHQSVGSRFIAHAAGEAELDRLLL